MIKLNLKNDSSIKENGLIELENIMGPCDVYSTEDNLQQDNSQYQHLEWETEQKDNQWYNNIEISTEDRKSISIKYIKHFDNILIPSSEMETRCLPQVWLKRLGLLISIHCDGFGMKNNDS